MAHRGLRATPTWWSIRQVEAYDLVSLGRALAQLERASSSCVIRGEPLPGINSARTQRLKDAAEDGTPPSVTPAARRWFAPKARGYRPMVLVRQLEPGSRGQFRSPGGAASRSSTPKPSASACSGRWSPAPTSRSWIVSAQPTSRRQSVAPAKPGARQGRCVSTKPDNQGDHTHGTHTTHHD